MRFLEVRRHTMRSRPGKHLSQPGVDLARRVGAEIGPFELVVASDLPRALETAIAMGFAVDERFDWLAELEADSVDWTRGFPAWSAALREAGTAARAITRQAKRWRRLLETVADGAAVLAISHGGVIEGGAVAGLPDADHAVWGRALDYCEGVRLSFDGDRITDVALLRLSGDSPIDERIRVTPG